MSTSTMPNSAIWTSVLPNPAQGTIVASSFDEAAKEQLWRKREAELNRLKLFEDDWDGEGGEAPSPAIMDTAERFLRLMRQRLAPPPSRINVTSDGTIVIAWKGGSQYTEAEVDRPNVVAWMFKAPGQPTMHLEQEVSFVPARTKTGRWYEDSLEDESERGSTWCRSGGSTARF